MIMKNALLAFLAILMSITTLAQDQTLRVDYIFSGTDKSQEISLDEMSRFEGWAGRRVNLDKAPLRGASSRFTLLPAQPSKRDISSREIS